MNYLSQLFPWLKPQRQVTAGGKTGYCVTCTTDAGLPGARFAVGSPCRQGYGCMGGAMVLLSQGLHLRFSDYSQQQLNDMVASIADLQKKYDDSVVAYNTSVTQYNEVYAKYGNCDCSQASCSQSGHPCNCNGSSIDPKYVGSCPGQNINVSMYGFTSAGGRGLIPMFLAKRDSAKATMDNNNTLLTSAKNSYKDALDQFEREQTANMSPAQRAAYEAAKQATANAAASAATKTKLLKWAGVTGLVLATGFVLVWGGKKVFRHTAPLVTKAAA